MRSPFNRREFLQVAGSGAAAAGLGWPSSTWAADENNPKQAGAELRKVGDHSLVTIVGKPRERGRQYGEKFSDAIHAFLEREIIEVCAPHSSRADLLHYARDC